MSVEVAAIVARLEADTRDFDQKMGKADKRIEKLEQSGGKASGAMSGLKTAIGAVGVAVAGAKIAQYAGDAVQLAMAAAEVDSKFQAVYGSAEDLTRSLSEWGDVAGVTDTKAKDLAASFGNLAMAQGVSVEDTEALSLKVATLAGDMASFNDADPAMVFEDLNKALLTTEREGMKKYGIAITETEIQTIAMGIAVADGRDEITQADKALASYEIVVRQAGKAIGDLDRTSDSAANKQRQLKASLTEVQEEIGTALLPVMEDLLSVTNDLIPVVKLLAGAFGIAVAPAENLSGAIATVGDETQSNVEKTTNLGVAWLKSMSLGFQFAQAIYKVADGGAAAKDAMKEFSKAADASDTAIDDVKLAAYGFLPTMRDIAAANKAAKETFVGYVDALKASVDPVFAAISAVQAFNETLVKIDEDGQRTNEELVELAKVTLDAQIAMNNVNSGNITQMLDLLTGSLGLSQQAAEDLLRELGLLDGKHYVFTVEERRIMTETQGDRYKNAPIGVDDFIPKHHLGGIVGGMTGSDEVLSVLLKGEGVIDKQTMQRGVNGGGTTVVVNVAGSVTTEQKLAESIRRSLLDVSRRNGSVGLS